MNKRRKKTITCILICALFFISMSFLSAQTPTVRVQYRCPETNTQEYTPTIQVNFKIVNDPSSIDLDLSLAKVTYCYSYEGLTEQSASVTYATGDNQNNVIVTFVPGSAEITFTSGAGILAPGGEFEVHFEITKENGENFLQKGDFSWDATYVNYANFIRMAFYYEDYSYGATCTAPTAEPTETFNTPPPIINNNICGDVNGDGRVIITDALLIAQKYVGLEPMYFTAPEEVGDVNCDGRTIITDALLVAQLYVGVITELNCCIPKRGIRIEAENYNRAFDNSIANEGLRYRTTFTGEYLVDLEDCWLGSFNTGWVNIEEWLEFDLELEESGNYDVYVAVAHDDANDLTGRVVINYRVIDEMVVPNTDPYGVAHPPGHWQNWVNYGIGSVQLNAGLNRIRMEHTGTVGGGFNVDFIWLGLDPGEPPSLGEIAPVPVPEGYQSPVNINGQLQVIGNNLCNSAGNPVQLKGLTTHSEIRWLWICKDFTVQRLAYDLDIDVFRVSIVPTASNYGYLASGHKEVLKERLIAYIDDTIEAGIYGIIDWHVYTAIDMNADTIDEAKLFFDEMSQRYAAYPNIIYEICADPPETFSWEELKDYADQIIPYIRNNAPDSIIIMGTPMNNKYVDIASQVPLGHANILYTLGFAAGTDSVELRDIADTAISNGLPLIVSSWKTSNAADNAYNFEESQVWVDWMATNNISWTNFSVCNKDELPSIFIESTGYTGGTGEDAQGFTGGFMGPWVQDDLSEGGQWIFSQF